MSALPLSLNYKIQTPFYPLAASGHDVKSHKYPGMLVKIILEKPTVKKSIFSMS